MLAFLLTPAEACEVLRASSEQLEELTLSGRLPAVQLTPGGPLRYRSEDVVALVDRLTPAALLFDPPPPFVREFVEGLGRRGADAAAAVRATGGPAVSRPERGATP